jgi:hypothetical protein
MRKISDIISKPSQAVQAMLDGMRASAQWKNFGISMSTFGGSFNEMCYGCAATCAVYQIFEEVPTAENIMERHHTFNVVAEDLSRFEMAIDAFRFGRLEYLFQYFGVDVSLVIPYECRIQLYVNNWKNQVEEIEKIISELKLAGI